MQLSILKCPDRDRFRPYIKRAAHYYASQLISSKKIQDLQLTIKFDRKLEEYGYASVSHHILNKKGYGLEDSRAAISIVEKIRGIKI